jgi:hypothetical protein
MVVVKAIIAAIIGIAIAAIFIAAVFTTSLGLIANGSSGNAMKNVSSSAISLYNLLPLFVVLVSIVALAGIIFVILQGGIGRGQR